MEATSFVALFFLGLSGTGHCIGMCGPLVFAFPGKTGHVSAHLCYHAGRLCTFVRFTACNVRCGYCDTEYAFHGGVRMSIDDVLTEVAGFNTRYVCVTGGEPLAQRECLPLLQLRVLIHTLGVGSSPLRQSAAGHAAGQSV